jgi:hypothetical protein
MLIGPATAWERAEAGQSCNRITPNERRFDNLDCGWRSGDMADRGVSPGQKRSRPNNPPRREGHIGDFPMTI